MKNNKDKYSIKNESGKYENSLIETYKCEGQLKFLEDSLDLKIVEDNNDDTKNRSNTLRKYI